MSTEGGKIGLGTYTAVFSVLMALTALTVCAAFVDMGLFNNVVALGIATTKAVLVLLYFMHLRYSTALTRLAVTTGILFFAILVAFTMSDVVTRTLLGSPAF